MLFSNFFTIWVKKVIQFSTLLHCEILSFYTFKEFLNDPFVHYTDYALRNCSMNLE